MKRTVAFATAIATGLAGFTSFVPPASAGEPPTLTIKAKNRALADLRRGRLQEAGWRGRRHWRGRHRHWRGHRHHRRGYGAAAAAGIAGLAAGAIIADSARRDRYRSDAPSKRWCANHYKSYDWRSESYLGYDGRRHSCP